MPDSKARVIAIDQGTLSTRAILFDSLGNQLAVARRPVALDRIDRQRVEQDGAEILASVREVITEILETAGSTAIAAAGLATQRSSVIAWNRQTGEPLSPVLSWQDRREQAWIEELQPRASEVQRITGLRLTPHYGASKLRWLLRHDHRVRQAAGNGTLALGPLAAFLIANLVAGHPNLVDHANASRTQLLNLQTADWEPQLLALFGIRQEWLPATQPIRADYGLLSGTSIPLTAVNGDQTAALFANGAIGKRDLYANLGTGAFVLKPTGDRLVMHDALLSGLCDSSDGKRSYLVEGTVNGAGAALRWVYRSQGFDTSPEAVGLALDACPDPDLLFINSIGGLGSPWWREGPETHWFNPGGSRIATPDARVAVASLIESILFLLARNISALRETGEAGCIRISGGLSQHDEVCRKLAALTGLPVMRMNQPEATARGIAWLALGRPQGWNNGEPQRFAPVTDAALQRRYRQFIRLLGQPD